MDVITITEAVRLTGVACTMLYRRMKRLGIKPVEGKKYNRGDVLRVAAMRVGSGRALVPKAADPGTITIADASREAGIGAATLRHRLKTSGIDPVERRPVHGDLYRRDEIMPVAREPLQKGRPKGGYKLPPRKQDHIGDKCSRCGKFDYGNEVRGGLCLDCFCHDFCKERGI